MGEACDIQMRPILDCGIINISSHKSLNHLILNHNSTKANNFKKISNKIIQNTENSSKNVEFLPINWHEVIHSDKEK